MKHLAPRQKRKTKRATVFSSVIGIGGIAVFAAACSPTIDHTSVQAETISLSSAIDQQIDKVLPTQQQIATRDSFTYLMAMPTVEEFSADTLAGASGRVPATLAEGAVTDPEVVSQVNASCASYEQIAKGLVSTPDADLSFTEGKQRRISLGQNGINQITGYNTVLTTDSASTAEDMVQDFVNNTSDCATALSQLYPQKQGQFDFRSAYVDKETGIATVNGLYNGDHVVIAVAQHDKYVTSTWFRAMDTAGVDQLEPTAETVQNLTVQNTQKFS